MQKQDNGRSKSTGRLPHPPQGEARTRTRSLWSLLSGLGCTLFVVLAAVVLIPYSQTTYAAATQTTVTTTAKAKLLEGKNNKGETIITFSAKIEKTTLFNTTIMAHVHSGSCTGPIVFMLPQGTTDGKGKLTFTATSFHDEGPEMNNHVAPKNIPHIWFFNIHDAAPAAVNPVTHKPQSIGCSQFTSKLSSATANITKQTVTF